MLSHRFKKSVSRNGVYGFWIYLYNLFFILNEFQKLISGSLPHVGFLLIWTYLVTFVSPAPTTFPSRTAKNHFEMASDGSYLFFYDTGPGQHQSFREEKRNIGGTISGTYGYVDPLGVLHITEYIADNKGYRASLEVYEPIRQIPEGPALIVGPLPTDLRSPDERANQESVFDKYKFPLEPFESLKIETPSLIYSDVINKIRNPDTTTTSRSSASTKRRKSDEKEVSENDLETNRTSLLVDIETLQKQLKSLSLLLQEDPLLLIGPLPGDLPKLLSTNIDDETVEADQKFRSSIEHKKPSNGTLSPTNSTDDVINYSNLRHSEFGVIIPSITDLNYVEKDLVSKGVDINSFLTFPSSDLLQGANLLSNEANTSLDRESTISKNNNISSTFFEEDLQTNVTEEVASSEITLPTPGNAVNNISLEESKPSDDSENKLTLPPSSSDSEKLLFNENILTLERSRTFDDQFSSSSEEIIKPDSKENINFSFENIISSNKNENTSTARTNSSETKNILLLKGIIINPNNTENNQTLGENIHPVSSEHAPITRTEDNDNSFIQRKTTLSSNIQSTYSTSDLKPSISVDRIIYRSENKETSLPGENKSPDDVDRIISPSDSKGSPLSARKHKSKKSGRKQKHVQMEINDPNSVYEVHINY